MYHLTMLPDASLHLSLNYLILGVLNVLEGSDREIDIKPGITEDAI